MEQVFNELVRKKRSKRSFTLKENPTRKECCLLGREYRSPWASWVSAASFCVLWNSTFFSAPKSPRLHKATVEAEQVEKGKKRKKKKRKCISKVLSKPRGMFNSWLDKINMPKASKKTSLHGKQRSLSVVQPVSVKSTGWWVGKSTVFRWETFYKCW